MHDREFEKQVQQKMDELRFAPGADVWARVQADIRPKRRRRPVLIWLLLAGLLVGGSWFLYTGMQENESKIAKQEQVVKKEPKVEKESDGQSTASQPGNTNSQQQPAVKAPEESTNIPNTTVVAPQTSRKPDNIPSATRQTTTAAKNINFPETTKQRRTNHQKTKDERRMDEPKPNLSRTSDEPVKNENIPVVNEKTVKDKNIAQEKPLPVTDQPSQTDKVIAELPKDTKGNDNKDNKEQNNTSPTPSAAIDQPKEEAKDRIAMKKQPAKKAAGKNSNWQWGISAGGGVSDLGKQLFEGTTVADLAYNGGMAPAAPPPIRRPSTVEAGVAFNAGGYISKGLGRKFRVKLGLNYEYLSNRVTVGSYIGSTRFVNQGNAVNVVQEYYIAGNTNEFTNQYHFVSMPLSLQWQITNHAKRNIVWENSIAPALLAKTDALHYDGITGSYYKDNNVFKQTQWMVSSSLLFSIKTKNNLQLYAGPHVQYGISNMVKNDAEDNKHLRYAGLKVMVGFNKK